MGQYYKIVNVDKQEVLDPFDYGNGCKLTEWTYADNDVVLALMNLIAGYWKGDRVCVLGDYAEPDNPLEVWYDTLLRYLEGFPPESLYHISDDFFAHVMSPVKLRQPGSATTEEFVKAKVKGDITNHGYRYIYNHATKQVIDISKCPIEGVWYDNESQQAMVTQIAPLPLLLAMGNGRGGGDYHNEKNENLVGSWCETVQSVEVSRELIKGTENYTEFAPDFTEQVPLIPYTESQNVLEKEEQKYHQQNS